MGRVSKPSPNDLIESSWAGAFIDDYVSQTDSNAQSVASALTFNGTVTLGSGMTAIQKLKLFVASGSNPITIAHGMGSAPKCVVSANAVQPYAIAWNSDATNIMVYHNAAGSLTVTILAWIT